MANILTVFNPGATLYYVIVDSLGRIWNGSLLVVVNLNDWVQYALPLPESAPPGTFETQFPTAIHIADSYSLIAYEQLGIIPAISDPAVRAGIIGWDGHQEVDTGPGIGGGGGGGSNFEESFDVGAEIPHRISILTGVTPFQ